ncbi:MAG TPA: DUF3467 domain-containing protein [Patescibacteria group bacterium]|nr:DUF3467 domain-containing protein [Patescibacteria group bacterium]
MDIKAPEGSLGGKYANMMQVSHTPEEFVLDFISAFPPAGELVARLIVSPRHMKRIVRALADNVNKYEQIHGLIQEANEPKLLS